MIVSRIEIFLQLKVLQKLLADTLMDKFDYTKEDIVNALLKVGLQQNDNVFSHSNLGFFGRLKGGSDNDSYCTAFKDAFFEVIGPGGTLVVPTFTYSYCWNKI